MSAPWFCSFCGRHEDYVERLVAGPNRVAICEQCIDDALNVVADERAKKSEEGQ